MAIVFYFFSPLEKEGFMETIWTVEGDGRFFSEKPVLNVDATKIELPTNNSFELKVIKLMPSDGNFNIINKPNLYQEKLYRGLGLIIRSRGYNKWKKFVRFEEIWDPEKLQKRRWVPKHEGEGPFSSLNIGMAVISTQAACEGLGLCPPSKSYSQLVSEYHRGYK